MLTSAIAVLVLAAGTVWAVTLGGGEPGAPRTFNTARSAAPSAAAAATATASPTPTPTAPAPAPEPTPPGFDTSARSIDDPTSLWLVVNKARPIPDGADYVPPDLVDLRADIPNPNGFPLRQEAADALANLVDAANAEIGVQLVAQSGYRSYGTQVNAYNYYVNLLGTAGADLTSARPGFSEHQTGLSIDILDTMSGCSVDGPCFGDTTAGRWLVANAYRFGYMLRYPADKTPVTGYEYEPWHFRYVGIELATQLHNTGTTTLEEFFGLSAAPRYLG